IARVNIEIRLAKQITFFFEARCIFPTYFVEELKLALKILDVNMLWHRIDHGAEQVSFSDQGFFGLAHRGEMTNCAGIQRKQFELIVLRRSLTEQVIGGQPPDVLIAVPYLGDAFPAHANYLVTVIVERNIIAGRSKCPTLKYFLDRLP